MPRFTVVPGYQAMVLYEAKLDTIDAVLDLINAKLVTGTVTGDVNLGAVDNAVLDAILLPCP